MKNDFHYYELILLDLKVGFVYNIMLLEDTEGIHRSNVQKLIDLYGINREQEIRDLYSRQRSDLEAMARIKDHIPFFTYQQTERVLIDWYGKPIKVERTAPEVETPQSPQPKKPRFGLSLLRKIPFFS